MEDPLVVPRPPPRAVTAKSVLFGLAGIAVVSGLAGFHDLRIPGPLMVGSHLPAGAYFFVVLVALVWNLIFSRLWPRLVLSPRELVVVMGMTLMACFPPTSGLFRYFQRQLVLPWYFLNSGGKSEWEAFGLLDSIPSKLFPQPAPRLGGGILQLDNTVYVGFFQGLAKGRDTLGLTQLPWHAWLRPMLYWGPLLVFMSVCVMAMSMLVHQQWAHHEQLSYPLAQVALSFLRRRVGRGVPDLFRMRLFWWGFVPVLLFYALEYLHQWFPLYVPGFDTVLPNLKTWWVPLAQKMPILRRAPEVWTLSAQTIFFSVVGIAYFVSAEISLTVGLCSVLLAGTGLWFYSITGTPLAGNDLAVSRGGAYLGYALILLYTGRTYYLAVLKKAVGLGRSRPHEAASVTAARLTVCSFAGFVAMLVLMGLDWLVALGFSLLLMLLFLVFTRIICETGIPFLQAYWFPGPLLASIFGPAALGPGPLVFVLYLGTILCQDPRECLMPYVATSIKMADDAGLGTRRFFAVLTAAVVIALVVAFVSTTWTLYNFGGMAMDRWANWHVPQIPFDDAARQIAEMKETGLLDQSRALSGWGKLRLFSPAPSDLGYLTAGVFAVLVFSALRFRFARFPIHPVLFLLWGTYPAQRTWASFLIGWGVKRLVVRFGGGRVYEKLKPLFIGIIAGELIAVGASIFIQMIHYWITGTVADVTFGIMPG